MNKKAQKPSQKKETQNQPKSRAEKVVFHRPPIITLMGHVDHGKTSLLDAIRESQITSTESGGITQHTGAYTVEKDGKKLTFIDTPGHEAFTQMRARGGKAADIVILVVAADDGVMPQTKEAIMHAKAANVPIVVAINKVDLASADIKKVKRQLAEEGIMVEGYGGDIVAVEVSATAKKGINDLLEVLTLVAELNDSQLEADPSGQLELIVIESKQDSRKGIIVNAIVKNGTLVQKDDLLVGSIEGRVKSMNDSYKKILKEAWPGDSVEILGFNDLPEVGGIIIRKSEKGMADNVEEEVNIAKNNDDLSRKSDMKDIAGPDTGEEILQESTDSKGKKVLNLVIRADTAGTMEAIVSSINKISKEDAYPNILLSGTGDVKESDVLLASTARAVVIAFKVNVQGSVSEFAKEKKVIIREHEIIYHLLEEIEGALEGVVEIEEAKIRGRGLVIKLFKLPKSGMTVCGTLVTAGKFKVKDRVGIFREDDLNPLYITRISSIHIGIKEVERAQKGDETGLLFKPQIDDIQLDDKIEIF